MNGHELLNRLRIRHPDLAGMQSYDPPSFFGVYIIIWIFEDQSTLRQEITFGDQMRFFNKAHEMFKALPHEAVEEAKDQGIAIHGMYTEKATIDHFSDFISKHRAEASEKINV